jgi:hypothetical protein
MISTLVVNDNDCKLYHHYLQKSAINQIYVPVYLYRYSPYIISGFDNAHRYSRRCNGKRAHIEYNK